MDDPHCYLFFLEPADPRQRKYEALRAVFLDQTPQNEVAARFGFSHDLVRRMVSDFRHQCRQGQTPLFSIRHDAAVR
ncbi:MAG: hypothetical protein WBB46_11210 [Candidatus Deferrimicrobiaceae bacterium]